MKKLSNEDIQRACDESLIQAATANNMKDIQILLDAGANPYWNNAQAMVQAIAELNLQAVQMMVKNNDTIYVSNPAEAAAYYDQPRILEYLLPMLDDFIDLNLVLMVAAKHSKTCFDLVLPLCDPRAIKKDIEDAIFEEFVLGHFYPGDGDEMREALRARCAELDCRDRLAALVQQAQVSQAPTPSLRRRI